MTTSVVDHIYDDMRSRILRNEFSANGVFVEQSIAAEYNVSRGTAREALQKLCQAKFLIKHPRKGYFIYNFSDKEINDLIYARYYLELGASKLIMTLCTDEQISSLYDTLKGPEFQYLPEKTVNNQFHMAVAKLSGNLTICDLLSNLLDISSRRSVNTPSSAGEWSHRHIVEALLARDVDQVGTALAMDLHLKLPA